LSEDQKNTVTGLVKGALRDAGFLYSGISAVEPMSDDSARLDNWLSKGYHAGMKWMSNHREKREDPQHLVDGAKSVISVLYNYFPKNKLPESHHYILSKYAYGEDYHFVIRRKLNEVIQKLRDELGHFNARAFTDSAPVFDRAWAERAGLGWIGKNTCLINPKIGSFFFIGEIICDLELEYDSTRISDLCGGCHRCIDACPTDALKEERVLDSNLCISYYTIEHRGELPEGLKPLFGKHIFGCDICQDVCPWNRIAKPHHEEAFEPPKQLEAMNKEQWESLDVQTFEQLFKKSPVKRTGYDGLKRNINFVKPDKPN
jgi:epoxyqueuosine reductase